MGATPSSPARWRGGLKFPVILIVLGIMFLLDQLVPGCGLGKTWPLLLVVFGVLELVDVARPPRPPEGPRV
ncbi:MAG: DUF5668 domain-containing protein [Terriglobia bacterium]